jgi:hypothetical protein
VQVWKLVPLAHRRAFGVHMFVQISEHWPLLHVLLLPQLVEVPQSRHPFACRAHCW